VKRQTGVELLETKSSVTFTWENKAFDGVIEQEYENSFLVQVANPSKEMIEKYNGRMIVSKKICKKNAS